MLTSSARTWCHQVAGKTSTCPGPSIRSITAAAMLTFRGYVQCHGLPRSLYVDRDSIYEPTRDLT